MRVVLAFLMMTITIQAIDSGTTWKFAMRAFFRTQPMACSSRHLRDRYLVDSE
jgi:hypothetical protein